MGAWWEAGTAPTATLAVGQGTTALAFALHTLAWAVVAGRMTWEAQAGAARSV